MTTQQKERIAEPLKNSTLAIVSLVAGIAGWTILPAVGSIVAVITGHLAKKEIRESMGQLGDDALATAGLLMGYAWLALFVFLCALGLFAVMLFFPFFSIRYIG
jgi:hypothetical protein